MGMSHISHLFPGSASGHCLPFPESAPNPNPVCDRFGPLLQFCAGSRSSRVSQVCPLSAQLLNSPLCARSWISVGSCPLRWDPELASVCFRGLGSVLAAAPSGGLLEAPLTGGGGRRGARCGRRRLAVAEEPCAGWERPGASVAAAAQTDRWCTSDGQTHTLGHNTR